MREKGNIKLYDKKILFYVGLSPQTLKKIEKEQAFGDSNKRTSTLAIWHVVRLAFTFQG